MVKPIRNKSSRFEATQFLLLANLIVMTSISISAWRVWSSDKTSSTSPSPGGGGGQSFGVHQSLANFAATDSQKRRSLNDGGIGSTDPDGFYFVHPREGERDFYKIGQSTQTDKVAAPGRLPGCLADDASCTRPSCARPESKTGPYSRADIKPFQFLEIGFFNGKGYDGYREFLPNGECHSIEISCIEQGPREEGKWPWGNFAEVNPKYQAYLDENRLHCGDAFNVTFLDSVWKNEMKRPDAPPLKIVVDDGAHLSEHMAQSVFYWFPRIEPRGLLVVEDIQPIQEANAFRTQFLPQIMKDLHFCGDPAQQPDELCFPTLFPLLASIHCEMHICIFERNDHPAKELSLEESTLPKNALDLSQCKSMMQGHW
ncbi:hypothetical protein ACHAWU_002888 [Discostella pseudostelligera]|uniref:Uncharacterized protein n=1 Tax=Discostella pseudostelligera TaxID=259834 RepID=A0ABD3M2U8_9STRA